MTVDTKANQPRKFRDLGVVELADPTSSGRRRELVATLMGTMEEVKNGSGQVIIFGGITDRQKKYLVVHLNRHHRGLKERVQIDRGFPYHNGQRLIKGTRVFIKERILPKE